jgi:hypothetical protein
MPSEGELLTAGEDAHTIIGARIRGREEERGFREIGPVCKMLHSLGTEAFGIDHDGEWIASVRPIGEDIDLVERAQTRGF